jgi:NAD(P)-dependent dehydrogenase (short-subunit alcohol dehydrogenase family)
MGRVGESDRNGVPRVSAGDATNRLVLVVGPASDLTNRIVDRFESDHPPAVVSRMTPIARAEHITAAVKQAGRVDVLVVNATEDLDVDAREADGGQVISAGARLAEAFLWCQAAAALGMLDRGKGVIVIVGTVDGYHSEAGGSIRSMVHGGLLGLVRGLGVEWAALGIRVVGVAHSISPVRLAGGRMPPIGRHPTPLEVAETVEFVSSADASYLVAETIRVDGGFVAYQMF